MKVAIMQPYLFPYLGYFQLIHCVDQFIVHDDVQYIKGGWINRNRLLVDNKAHLFSFSLKKASWDLSINERYFASDFEQQKIKFKNALNTWYKRAPYYTDTAKLINHILENKDTSITAFITYQLEAICDYLGIQTSIRLSSQLNKKNDLKSEERVIHICKAVGGNHYVNPINGQELYEKEHFSREGIQLNFLKMGPVTYTQFGKEFIPSLSIIDVMMFNSKDKIKEKLKEYELI